MTIAHSRPGRLSGNGMAEKITSDLSELALDNANHTIMLNVRGSKVPCNASTARRMTGLSDACSKDAAGQFTLDLDPELVASVIKYISSGKLHHLLPAHITESPISAVQQLGVDLHLPESQYVFSTLELSVKPSADISSAKQLEVWDAAAALVLGLHSGRYQPPTTTSSTTAADDLFQALLLVTSHPSTFTSGIIAWAVATAEQHAPFLNQQQVDAITSSITKAAAAGSALAGPTSSCWYDAECESDTSEAFDSAESSSDYYDAASDQEN